MAWNFDSFDDEELEVLGEAVFALRMRQRALGPQTLAAKLDNAIEDELAERAALAQDAAREAAADADYKAARDMGLPRSPGDAGKTVGSKTGQGSEADEAEGG